MSRERHSHRRETRGHRRLGGDEGAVVVELAIIGPLVVALALGIFELGFALRNTGQVEHVALSAGRTGSTIADGSFADFDTLRSIDSGLEELNGAQLTKVVIFEADSPDGTVPDVCKNLDVTGSPLGAHGVDNAAARCNVYSPQQVAAIDPGVGFNHGSVSNPSCDAGDWDRFWCPPTDRDRSQGSADYLGVWISVDYDFITGLFLGSGFTIERSAVYRIEPEVGLP